MLEPSGAAWYDERGCGLSDRQLGELSFDR
jgi:hypothetical protein